MANEKVFQSRIQLKHDVEENWSKATNFIPKVGEIIIYDIDKNNSIARFKIGDGITNINSLSFVSHHEVISYLPQELTEEQQMQARENLGLYRKKIEPILITQGGPDTPGRLWDMTQSLSNEVRSDAYTIEIWDANPEQLREKFNFKKQGERYSSGSGGEIHLYWYGNLDLIIQNDATAATIANKIGYTSEGQYTDVPFVLYTYIDEDQHAALKWCLFIDSSLTPLYWIGFIVKIFSNKTQIVYHPVPEEYIPDTIARINQIPEAQVQADWNQNDKNAINYIKNRPFYENITEFDFIPEQELEFSSGSANVSSLRTDDYINGDTYYLTIDGVTTKGIMEYIGNPIYDYTCSFENGWKYQFGDILANINDGIHTIRMYRAEGEIRTIDSKYLNFAISNGTASTNTAIVANNIDNNATGDYSMAEGYQTEASGDYSHAEGNGTTASGNISHAEGNNTTASGISSHAEGQDTTASNRGAHSEGEHTIASGLNSHTEGSYTTASGHYSHSEGKDTTASGNSSHAEGYQTNASGDYQHAQGKFNIEDTISAHIVGNGTAENARSNAHTLDWQGNAWYQGDVYVGSTSGTNKDEGSKKLATEEYVDSKAVKYVEQELTEEQQMQARANLGVYSTTLPIIEEGTIEIVNKQGYHFLSLEESTNIKLTLSAIVGHNSQFKIDLTGYSSYDSNHMYLRMEASDDFRYNLIYEGDFWNFSNSGYDLPDGTYNFSLVKIQTLLVPEEYIPDTIARVADVETSLATKLTIPETASVGQLIKVSAVDGSGKVTATEGQGVAYEDEALDLLYEMKIIEPIAAEDGKILTLESGEILLL